MTRPRPWAAAGLAALAAALFVAWRYAPLFDAGFRGDDYVILRAWTHSEMRAVLTGSWDPTGFNEPYYRPLTGLYQSALRPLVGTSPRVLHGWSLVCLTLIGLGLMRFVAREAGRPGAGWWALAIYLTHPMVPDSTAAWIFNQFHALEALVVVGGLLAWQRLRSEPEIRRWPVVVLALVAFAWKEDGLMLIPAAIGLRALRAWWIGDTTPPTWQMIVEALALTAGVIALRFAVLAVALPPPTLQPLQEWTSSLWHVTVNLPWGADAGYYAVSLPALSATIGGMLAVAAGARRRDSRAYPPPAAGLWLMLCFSLPLLSIGGPTRSHLITIAAAVLWAGTMDWLVGRARPGLARAAVVVLGTSLVLSGASRTGDVLQRYASCSGDTLTDDGFRADDPVFSTALRQWFRDKRTACDAGAPIPALPADWAGQGAGPFSPR